MKLRLEGPKVKDRRATERREMKSYTGICSFRNGTNQSSQKTDRVFVSSVCHGKVEMTRQKPWRG